MIDPETPTGTETTGRIGGSLSLRTRMTIALLTAVIMPVAILAVLLVIVLPPGQAALDRPVGQLILASVAVAVVVGAIVSVILAGDITRPFREIARLVERVSAGDLTTRIEVTGEDELARLIESHNRLAGVLARRNRELARIMGSLAELSPSGGVAWLAERAAVQARSAFEMIDADVLLVDPREVPVEETIPGLARPVRSGLVVDDEVLGVITGHVPAVRSWDSADQNLFELFAAQVAAGIRSAELLAQVEAQNARLLALDEVKDDFLRGVSHNLQSPLARITASAHQLAAERPDRRLGLVIEQSERLSRMVRQLLTVTRIESGALRPYLDVLSVPPRIRRAWEALAADPPLEIEDTATGWLAITDPDQLDQVLWALLDNAAKYGEGSPVRVTLGVEVETGTLLVTIRDGGAGIPETARATIFGRFERVGTDVRGGTGLGLYVSRELCRAMGGDLILEPFVPGEGAAFTMLLPAERAEDA